MRKVFAAATPLSLDEQTNLLATIVREQWEKAAIDRRLLRSPLPIRWRRSVSLVDLRKRTSRMPVQTIRSKHGDGM